MFSFVLCFVFSFNHFSLWNFAESNIHFSHISSMIFMNAVNCHCHFCQCWWQAFLSVMCRRVFGAMAMENTNNSRYHIFTGKHRKIFQASAKLCVSINLSYFDWFLASYEIDINRFSFYYVYLFLILSFNDISCNRIWRFWKFPRWFNEIHLQQVYNQQCLNQFS